MVEGTQVPREEEIPVQAYVLRLFCPGDENELGECGGEMKYTGEQKMSSPPYNIHKCDKCGKRHAVLATAPSIRGWCIETTQARSRSFEMQHARDDYQRIQEQY